MIPTTPLDFTFYCKLSKFILDYISGLWATQKLVSKPPHWDFHRNCRLTYILPNFLEVFLRYLYYCRRKVFYKGDNKINKFSNSKCNLVSRFNKLQDATRYYRIKFKRQFWGPGTPLWIMPLSKSKK